MQGGRPGCRIQPCEGRTCTGGAGRAPHALAGGGPCRWRTGPAALPASPAPLSAPQPAQRRRRVDCHRLAIPPGLLRGGGAAIKPGAQQGQPPGRIAPPGQRWTCQMIPIFEGVTRLGCATSLWPAAPCHGTGACDCPPPDTRDAVHSAQAGCAQPALQAQPSSQHPEGSCAHAHRDSVQGRMGLQ